MQCDPERNHLAVPFPTKPRRILCILVKDLAENAASDIAQGDECGGDGTAHDRA
jgi:hypothetical protein